MTFKEWHLKPLAKCLKGSFAIRKVTLCFLLENVRKLHVRPHRWWRVGDFVKKPENSSFWFRENRPSHILLWSGNELHWLEAKNYFRLFFKFYFLSIFFRKKTVDLYFHFLDHLCSWDTCTTSCSVLASETLASKTSSNIGRHFDHLLLKIDWWWPKQKMFLLRDPFSFFVFLELIIYRERISNFSLLLQVAWTETY